MASYSRREVASLGWLAGSTDTRGVLLTARSSLTRLAGWLDRHVASYSRREVASLGWLCSIQPSLPRGAHCRGLHHQLGRFPINECCVEAAYFALQIKETVLHTVDVKVCFSPYIFNSKDFADDISGIW